MSAELARVDRVRDLLSNLASLDGSPASLPCAVRALRILAETAGYAVVPNLDPAVGRDIAGRFDGLATPLRSTLAGAVPGDDVAVGLSAVAAIARTFGRSWDDLCAFVGMDLMTDRIGNVLILANAVEVAVLRWNSIERGEQHRRSVRTVLQGA